MRGFSSWLAGCKNFQARGGGGSAVASNRFGESEGESGSDVQSDPTLVSLDVLGMGCGEAGSPIRHACRTGAPVVGMSVTHIGLDC